MDLRISRGADIPVASPAKIRHEIPCVPPSLPRDRKRSRPECGHISSWRLHRKNMRDGLVNFQTKVWASSFSSAARFACAPICTPRRRLHLPHSDCLKYLFTSSARGGAPLIIARANARSHPGRFTAHAFNPTTVPLHTRGTRGVHTYLPYTRTDDVYRRKGGIPPVASSWLIALSSSCTAHPPVERRDRKNSNFACAADKTASSYI